MTKVELGQIMRLIREEILHLKQSELADKLGLNQGIVSRFENGTAGSIEMLLDVMTLLREEHKLKPHLIFREPFDLDLLINSSTTNIQQILAVIQNNQSEINKNFERLTLLVNALE